ncbi:hypothetical protein [Nocardia jiangsuensis]|uniref:DivIVA domain-containing protein n=1 Tax=Nocardia jiangsuensis TaxID=1691563 RepID=A0ABV8DYQ3_9NOCA
MYDEPRNRFVTLPFTVVRKGYAQDEVRKYFERFDAELRVTATDRDAAAAQARNLAGQLENVRAENDELRRQVERLAVSPTTAEDASDRISRVLRVAADEASEIRALAQAEADRLDKEAKAKRKAAQQDFEVTMSDRRIKLIRAMEELEAMSRAEAAQRIKDATAEADRLISSATQISERKTAHASELAGEVSSMDAISVGSQGSRTLLPASENL